MSDQTPLPLEPASLAYENRAFLNSPDGRIIRIMAEYAEPLGHFRRERIRDTVVFFGSARFHAWTSRTTSSNCWHVLTPASGRRIMNSRQRARNWTTAAPTS